MPENVINDIVNWLESQLQRNQGIKIDTITNKSGYSKWRLQRIFKQLKGSTLGKYVRKRRLLEAARLLREDKFSILVARECNINCVNGILIKNFL